jgi:hypothetical protein
MLTKEEEDINSGYCPVCGHIYNDDTHLEVDCPDCGESFCETCGDEHICDVPFT